MEVTQCLVLEHSMGGASANPGAKKSAKSRLPPSIRAVATTLDTPNVFRSEFYKLVTAVQDHQSAKQQQQQRARK